MKLEFPQDCMKITCLLFVAFHCILLVVLLNKQCFSKKVTKNKSATRLDFTYILVPLALISLSLSEKWGRGGGGG